MSFWNRTHNLSRMNFEQLVRAFVTYPAVHAYLLLAVISIAVAAISASAVLPLIVAVALAILVYPAVWYLLHRFVLHGRYLYK